MKPRVSHRLKKPQLRQLRKTAEQHGIYPIDIANAHGCHPSAVTNFFNGDSTSRPLLRTIQEMIEEAKEGRTPSDGYDVYREVV